MQGDEDVKGVGAQLSGIGGSEVDGEFATQDGAFEPLHHIELRADHRLVAAVADHRRHQPEDRAEGGLKVVLAAHVVGPLGLGAGRWASQDQVAVGIAQQVGQIGGATRVLADGRYGIEFRGLLRIRVVAQPGSDPRDVEGILRAHFSRRIPLVPRLVEPTPLLVEPTTWLVEPTPWLVEPAPLLVEPAPLLVELVETTHVSSRSRAA